MAWQQVPSDISHYPLPSAVSNPEYHNRKDRVLQISRRDQRFGMSAVTDLAVTGSCIDSRHLSALLPKHSAS